MVNIGTYKIPEIQKQYVKLKDQLEFIDHQKVVSKAESVEFCISYLQLAMTEEMRYPIYKLKFKYYEVRLMN